MNPQLIEYLTNGQIRILFVKKTNNLTRNILCTLNSELVPPEEHHTLAKIMANLQEPRLIVWDLEKNFWRSFYYSSIVDIIEVESINKNEKEASNGESKEEGQQGQ
jgi:hypothetical protein